jgi:hypothetical protein
VVKKHGMETSRGLACTTVLCLHHVPGTRNEVEWTVPGCYHFRVLRHAILVEKDASLFVAEVWTGVRTKKGAGGRLVGWHVRAAGIGQSQKKEKREFSLGSGRLLVTRTFKLDEGVGPARAHCLHPLVDECKVLWALDAGDGEAEVQGVVPECLVFRAKVEDDGECFAGVDAASCHVQGELSDGDGGGVGAEVAETQDTGPVGHDNDVDVILWPVVHHGFHFALVLEGKVHAAGAAVDGVKLEARIPYCRGLGRARRKERRREGMKERTNEGRKEGTNERTRERRREGTKEGRNERTNERGNEGGKERRRE